MYRYLAALVCLLVASSLTAQDDNSPYAGSWSTEAGEIVLVLDGEGPNFEGNVTFEGRTHPLTAQIVDELLKGAYTYDEEQVPFAAVIREGYLFIESGGEVFVLARSTAKAGDLAKAETSADAGASQGSDHPEAREWAEWFQGCRLSYFNRYNSGAGGGGYIDNTVIDLCPGYFRYNDQSETVFNSPDLNSSTYRSNSNRGSGVWRVIMQGGEPALQLEFHDGTAYTYVLSYEDSKTFLDGRRWLRTCNPNDSVVEARPNCQ